MTGELEIDFEMLGSRAEMTLLAGFEVKSIDLFFLF